MRIENRSLIGILLFVGAAQYILLVNIAEALYPGYSVATNAMSDLGVGQTAVLFNSSTVVFGTFILIGLLLGRRAIGTGLTITLAVYGACVVGVGVFPETTGALHGGIALVALVLALTHNYMGIGKGGMERMIVYPLFLWVLGFGGALIGSKQEPT